MTPSSLAEGDGLVTTDLYLMFEDVADQLLERLDAAARSSETARGRSDDDVLDCFLLAAGLNQILEDYLHRDFFALLSASAQLEPILPRFGSLARAIGNAACHVRAARPEERRLALGQRELARLVQDLGRAVAHGVEPDATSLQSAAERLLTPVEKLPQGLRQAILRLPNCFRSFDQRPEDCDRLVERFAVQWPERSRPLLVVGLRTSGSYLAPLFSAFLEAAGYEEVSAITVRPGRPLSRHDKGAIASAAAAGGLGLLVDDPPRTGKQLSSTAAMLKRRGLPPVLLLQLFDDGRSLPEVLRPYPLVLLPWRDWAIHERLRPEAAAEVLGKLVVGHGVRTLDPQEAEVSVTRVDVEPVRTFSPSRGHAGAVFSVRLAGAPGQGDVLQSVYAVGVGLGFFGRQALAVARALSEFVPPVYGLSDGLLFRAWLPEAERVTPQRVRRDSEALATAIARYVERRNRLLSAPSDPSLRLDGADTAWKFVGQMLGDPFGRAKPFVKPLTYRTARYLLSVEHPSVIDGDTAPWHWFGEPAAPLKLDFHERAFATQGIVSYDPVFDLAGAAAAAEAVGIGDFESRLRRHYEAESSVAIDKERWLLYRLLHLLRHYQALLHDAAEDPRHADASFSRLLTLERTMAGIHRTYVEQQYLEDLVPPESGPLCAIDIDGVLESRWLAFPAIAPAGALALRALNRHGYRVLLATGRSLEELRERCAPYRLTGGVAEYGSVVYTHANGRTRSLLTPSQSADLDALRAAAERRPEVYVDPPYRHSVRLHTLGSDSRRQGLSPQVIATLLADAGVEGRVRVIAGELQTDFVASDIDKGRGLRALADDLDAEVDPGKPFLNLAIGDTDSDLPMFELAENAVAPANATAAVRSRATTVGAARQAGLLAAVRRHVGHARCEDCVPPPPRSVEARLLLAAIAALDGGKGTSLVRAATLAFQLVSTRSLRSQSNGAS